jgi:hypothetical protein
MLAKNIFSIVMKNAWINIKNKEERRPRREICCIILLLAEVK